MKRLNGRRKNGYFRKIAAIAVSFAMLLTTLNVQGLEGIFNYFNIAYRAHATNTTSRNVYINSLEALYDFSLSYHNNSDFAESNDDVNLIINIDGVWVLEKDHAFDEETRKDFEPIGTASTPFMGKITINQTEASYVAIQTTLPIFDVVCDTVDIVNPNGNNQQLSIIRSDTMSGNVPLFANRIIHDSRSNTTASTWKIMISPLVDGGSSYAHDFSGIIGTVGADGGDNSEVNLEVDFAGCGSQHDANIISNESTGLVCGVMNPNTTVHVTLLGGSEHSLREGYSVTTTGDNKSAGGLVGEMGADTSLNVYIPSSASSYDISEAKTITASGSDSYAGGLVGKNSGGEVKLYSGTKGTHSDMQYISEDTVKAKEGAGGIFGYYLATDDITFNSLYGIDGCAVNAKNAGGFVGVFDAADYDITFAGASAGSHLSAEAIITTGNQVDCFGGLVGKYLSKDLSKTLDIEHVDITISKSETPSKSDTSAFGGLIGYVDGSESGYDAVYVKIDDVNVTATSGYDTAIYFGGMVGKTGEKGSLIDVGSVKLTTSGNYKGGGIVGNLNRGVLRLSGKTDLTAAPGNTSTAGSSTRGQIVGRRGAALVYALGTGEDSAGSVSYGQGWRFERYASNQYLDDIGSWGEVVRLNTSSGGTVKNIEDSTTGAVSYDASDHTVTVLSPKKTMSSTQDVVKTALNMQLNGGSDVGALCFEDKTNKSTVLLSSADLKIDGEISLAGTGITSLTRDDGNNNAFSGTLSGLTGSSTDKIILATGEKYGVPKTGISGVGEIFTHKYNGLFAKVGGGTIRDITIDGTINCNINVGAVYIGGAAAEVTNGFTASGVVLDEEINYISDGSTNNYVGGLIGIVGSGNSSNITVNSSSTISPVINASGNLSGKDLRIAGGIAYIDSVNSFNVTFSNSTLSYKVDGTSASSTSSDLHMAGLIADIKYRGAGANDDTRTVLLTGNTFSGCEIKNNATTSSGGMLGYSWLNTNTDFTGNTFSTGNKLWTNAKKLSALCYEATGYWQVKTKGLKIDDLSIKSKTGATIASNYVTDFGFIINTGYHKESGVISASYLEMQADDSYTLDSSGVVVPNMTSGTYDEFVAHTGENILGNNNGVISICLSEDLKMNGTECNSYQNVFNQTLKNKYSRYYYNVAAHKSGFAATGEDGWKLLIWSLNKYASTNIKRCFTDPFTNNTLSGDFDMEGISYYPIDIASGVSVTLGSSTVTFYNEQIEKGETASGNTDSMNRTTVGDSQHYLMHSGLFRNVSGSVNATGAVTFSGSIGMDSNYSGVLVNGSLGGSVSTTKNNYITFNNLSLRGTNGAKNDNGYLFIHSMGSNSTLTLNSVRLSGYPSDGSTYASSLIGDVVGTEINLTFSDIKLDGRNASGASAVSGLTSIYGTSRSIFKNATLLNKFDVNANSVAEYNYTVEEDWPSSHVGNVTYGREITDSVEYANKEKKYYVASDTGRKYTNPETTPSTSEYTTGFSSNFLPYVRYFTKETLSGYTPPNPTTTSYTLREIKVNVLSTDLVDGCGTYDHPYQITNPQQLKEVADMINGGSALLKISLPKTVSLHSNNSYNHWCLDSGNHTCTADYEYQSGSSTYTSVTTGAAAWTKDQVKEYLCGAYYQISGTLTLDTYVGLGATTDNSSGKYAFRGVIVGTSGAKIINNSESPLVKVSNGSVVKNLEIEVNTTANVVSSGAVNQSFGYTQTGFYYGGVIGEIMGGDNIIDNVTVSYDTHLRITNNNNSNNKPYLYTIGGYVGVVVNGGLIFRNMPADPLNNTNNTALAGGAFLVGANTAGSSYSRSTDYAHLYINPFVGRVINGYAINETDSYSGDTDTYTLDNSEKNYRIADINKNPGESIITFGDFTATGAKDKICIPDGQSLFMLSLITQSGAGSAPTATGTYAYGVGYDGTTRYDSTSASVYAATHVAAYTNVGDAANASADWTKSCADRVNSTTCIPYIISKYTEVSGGAYLARTVTSRTYMIELTTTGGNYKLPECFRGIGSICRLDGKANGATDEVTSVSPGDLNDEDGKFVMKIYGLKGNNSKIWINLNYKTYQDSSDNYIYTVYESTGTAMDKARNHIGFGLFNYVKQIPQSGKDNTTFNTTSGYYIGDFTMTGKVVVKEYTSGGTERTSVDGGTGDDNTGKNFRRYSHSVGGMMGVLCIDDYANLVNADMDDITISGPYMVGGYIGRVNITERNMKNGNNMNYIFVNGCDTEKTIIKCGGGHCSGIVAGSHAGYMSVYVNTATNTNTSDTKNRDSEGYYKSSMELSINNNSINGGCGTSGVIGGIRNGHSVNIWINNLSISGYYKEGVCAAEIKNTCSNYGKRTTNAVGGFIGYVRKAESIIITNSSVSNISINGQNAGGLFGYIDNFTTLPDYGTSPKIKVYNCDIYNDDNTSGYNITSEKNAGGITGGFVTNKTYEDTVIGYNDETYVYDIDGVNVYNYIISGATSSGGLIGTSENGIRTIVNSSVHDCTIKCGSSTSYGMGGIVGITKIAISGYNISAYNNNFTGLATAAITDAKKGNFIGITNNKAVKIVAFSRKNNTYNNSGLSADCGAANGSGGYIICSDYLGVCENESPVPNKTPSNMTDLPIDSPALADVDEGVRGDYFPHANVNPRTDMGGSETGYTQNFLTGDGMKAYIIDAENNTKKSVAGYIVNDCATGPTPAPSAYNNKSLYSAYSNAYSGSEPKKNGEFVKEMLEAGEDADVKLTTYGDEMGLPGGYLGEDFPVIALGGAATNYYYTNYIQSYIRLMTNTTDSYTQYEDGTKYKIKIWPCRFDSTTGQYNIITNEGESNNSIYISGNNYIMRENKADSLDSHNQFTLIDVQFLNPMDSSEVAYHLFVPVLTQKMAKFEFHSDVKQGTQYVASNYNLSANNVYAGNFDSWTTAYVQFKYSASDVNVILNTGRGLNWNSDKIITFNYSSDKDIANSTQFVLLDNNNNVDKEYYLNKSAVETTTSTGSYPKDNIVLSAFKEKDGSTPFEEQTLYDLAGDSIRYESNSSGGKYVEVSSGANGIVAKAYDASGNNVKYFKTYESGDSGNRYDLSTSADIVETYYLSMYTYSSDNVLSDYYKTDNAYAFTISCPTTLEGSVTSRKKSETISTVYIGNIFTQNLSFSGETTNQVMSEQNNELQVTLTSVVNFRPSENKNYLQNKLSAAHVKLYQGFLLYINKCDDDGISTGSSSIKEIQSYNYTISTNTDPLQTRTVTDEDTQEAPYIFVEPVEISIPSATENENWSSTQQAAISITFEDDETLLLEEFMPRYNSESNAGNRFYASANLDYSREIVEYATIRRALQDDDYTYYIQKDDELDLTLTADDQSVADEYDKYGEQSSNMSALGVNARYIETGAKYEAGYGNKEHIEAIANIDMTNLPDAFLDGDHSLELTLKLKQKQNSGTSGYTYVDVPINTYLLNFKLLSKDANNDGTQDEITSASVKSYADGKYTYTFPLTDPSSAWLINYDADQKTFDARVSFDVITGADFENIEGFLYSNYRLVMDAKIVDSSTGTNVMSEDTDWIVYTHAKVNAQFVAPSS